MIQETSPLRWRTSSYSGNADGNCVEVARSESQTALRDTKDRRGGTQAYTTTAWEALRSHLHP